METLQRTFHYNTAQTPIRTVEELDSFILESLDAEELSKSFLKEVKDDLYEALDSCTFIASMISADRKKASDLQRWDAPYKKTRKEDPKGRIAVNIHDPHILEDMDYFRQTAIHFEKTGRYTTLYPNPNPNSEYGMFWAEESRRCREGMMRESDGEWITGYHYFHLNYGWMQRVIDVDDQGEDIRAGGLPSTYDGDYLFFHYMDKARKRGKHTTTLKTRGSGFSYKAGTKLARNFIHGETTYNRVKTKSFAIANEKEYLTKDGILNKFLEVDEHCGEHTPWPRMRELKDSMDGMEWKKGYKDKKTGSPAGVMNNVMGVTLQNNAHRARGKRGILIEWEEVGSFTNFLKAWGIARPSVEANRRVFGLMNAYGTGGEEGVDFEGLQEIFYNPRGYGVLPVPNVYDKNIDGKTESAFFFATYMNAEDLYDENGNSDIMGALVETFVRRINIKYNTSDPNAIVQEKAEKPIYPQEAIMRTEGTAFPVGLLKDKLETIKADYSHFISGHYVGEIQLGTEGYSWKPNADLRPIHKFPIKNNVNMQGAVEIFEMPKKDRDHKVFRNRYIMGADPIDNDYSIRGSLASVFVFDLWTDRIVAEYSGRPILAEDYYDICIALSEFYRAPINYESNIKGLFVHFSNKNKVHLLCDTPQYLKDMELISDVGFGNRAKGTRTNTEIKKLGKTLQRSWMLTQNVDVVQNQDGTVEEVYFQNYQRIRSLGYLQECIKWNPDGNFDRVSAMDMVMILREDMKRRSTDYRDNYEPENEFEDDEFIDANWMKQIDKIYERQPAYADIEESYERNYSTTMAKTEDFL